MSLTNDKRTLYVGGLEESVTLDVLRAAFVPFGELVDVNLPTDPSGQKHRGFAFVQYEEQGDAADAIDNMDNAELYGRVLKVNIAKPDAMRGSSHRPVGSRTPTPSSTSPPRATRPTPPPPPPRRPRTPPTRRPRSEGGRARAQFSKTID